MEHQGKWYFFYHNRRQARIDGMSNYHRSINADYLYYNYDGTIQTVKPTNRGVTQLKPLNAFKQNPAELFDHQGGIEVGGVDPSARIYIESIQPGDWIKYSGVDFKAQATTLSFQAAADTPDWSFEVRSDTKTGKLHGTCGPGKRFNSGVWRTYRCELNQLKGVKDVFFVFNGNPNARLKLDWYQYN